MRRLAFLVLALSCWLTIGCMSAPSTKTAAVDQSQFPFEQDNIIYASPDGVDLKLDLMGPGSGAGPFPAVLFFPGNGWYQYPYRTRLTMRNHIETFAENGYVAVAVDTRKSFSSEKGERAYAFPQPVYDAKAALRWIRANAAKYKVDPERIGVAGWSSGGYLALMLALTREKDGLEGEVGPLGYSTSVAAAAITGVPLSFDFEGIENDAAVVGFLGSARAENPEAYRAASPINYLGKGAPPILQFEGEADHYNVDQAPGFHAKLDELGVPNELVIVPGGEHRDYLYDYNDRCLAFFDRCLKAAAR
jgi:acetyl esterase/lipase